MLLIPNQQKAKQTLGQCDILSPWGRAEGGDYSTPWLLPHPTTEFSDIKTICSSSTDLVLLKYCGFVPIVLSVCSTHPENAFSFSSLTLNFPLKPSRVPPQTWEQVSRSSHFQPHPRNAYLHFIHYHIPKSISLNA